MDKMKETVKEQGAREW